MIGEVTDASALPMTLTRQAPRQQRATWRRHLGTALEVAGGALVALGFAATALLAAVPSVTHLSSLVQADLAEHRAPGLSSLPKRIADAVVAAEDHAFGTPPGVDIAYGVVRYLYARLLGRESQGGSTIAQQLAKNVYLEHHAPGPIAELESVGLALKLELSYSPRQILTLYLEQAYYGDGAYGVTQAARRYFHRSPAQLDWAQAALLAGLLQAPSADDPLAHPRAARLRRNEVLGELESTGALSGAEAARSARRPVP